MIKRKTPLKRANLPRRTTKHTKTRKGALPSISKLIKACDKEFSIQVRMKGAWQEHGEWMNQDYTTGYIAPVKKLHCGHYLSRYYKAARWDFDNCRPQSYMTNIHMRGDPIRFRQKLVKEIGIKRVEAVEAKRDQSIKLSRQYLTDLLTSLTT